jgi:hypothetical protein
MPRVGEKFAYEMSWQEQVGIKSLTDRNQQRVSAPPQTAPSNTNGNGQAPHPPSPSPNR